jgi:hypothetical protein
MERVRAEPAEKLHKKKSKKSRANPPILENLSSQELVETYRSLHDAAQPYPHVCLYPLANDSNMRTIYNEAKHNMTATFKVPSHLLPSLSPSLPPALALRLILLSGN